MCFKAAQQSVKPWGGRFTSRTLTHSREFAFALASVGSNDVIPIPANRLLETCKNSRRVRERLIVSCPFQWQAIKGKMQRQEWGIRRSARPERDTARGACPIFSGWRIFWTVPVAKTRTVAPELSPEHHLTASEPWTLPAKTGKENADSGRAGFRGNRPRKSIVQVEGRAAARQPRVRPLP